jgi:hypothetical protein
MGLGSRPSPPFTPSSLGDRRSLTSTEGDEILPRPQGRKRYSSSFGHRYATVSGHGSDGSVGSGERREGERPGVSASVSSRHMCFPHHFCARYATTDYQLSAVNRVLPF